MLEVFDVKLKEAIYKLPFDKILTLKNVSGSWATPLVAVAAVACGLWLPLLRGSARLCMRALPFVSQLLQCCASCACDISIGWQQ